MARGGQYGQSSAAYFVPLTPRIVPGRNGSHGAEYTSATSVPGSTAKLASPNFHTLLNKKTRTVTASSPGTFQFLVPHCVGWAVPLTTTVGLGNHPSHGLRRVSSKRRGPSVFCFTLDSLAGSEQQLGPA